jgi:hypothetical protein
MAAPRPQKIVHTIYTPFTPDFCNKIGQEPTRRDRLARQLIAANV